MPGRQICRRRDWYGNIKPQRCGDRSGASGSVAAAELARFGNHAPGIDKNRRRAAALADQLSRVIIRVATDEGALREAGADRCDVGLVSIGNGLERNVIAARFIIGGIGYVLIAWFQGVTTRTAGFNTIRIGGLHDSTSLLCIALMVTGAGPTSAAGGLKVSTAMVMLLVTVAFFRRQSEVRAFGHSLGLDQVLKVMALIAIAGVLIFTATFILTASHDGHFLDIGFELASAFATTGLSRGHTRELGDVGRIVTMPLMFSGRVGAQTLGCFLATQSTPRLHHPKGLVHLG